MWKVGIQCSFTIILILEAYNRETQREKSVRLLDYNTDISYNIRALNLTFWKCGNQQTTCEADHFRDFFQVTFGLSTCKSRGIFQGREVDSVVFSSSTHWEMGNTQRNKLPAKRYWKIMKIYLIPVSIGNFCFDKYSIYFPTYSCILTPLQQTTIVNIATKWK